MQTTFAISLICIVLSITASGRPVHDCERPADEIFLILDSSGSIYVRDFKQMLASINHFIGNISTDGHILRSRIGAITFSDTAHLEFATDKYTDVGNLRDAILRIPHRQGQTYTSKALKLLQQQVTSLHRPETETPVVGIVITDGESTDPKATAEQAKVLHKMGVVMYAIGIGKRYKKEEMKRIATNPDTGVYEADNYQVLDSIFSTFYNITCLPPRPNNSDTDTGGEAKEDTPVLDEPSGDKTSKIIFGFDIVTLCRHQIRTIHDFIYEFIARSGYTYYSIVSDGKYTGHMNTPLSLTRQPLQRTPDFVTPIVNIVRHMNWELKFSRNSGGRQVAVLFVDSSSSVIPMRLSKMMDGLKKNDVEVFIIDIGTGKWPDVQLLHSLSSQPSSDYLYRIQTYDKLSDIVNQPDSYKNIYANSQKRFFEKQQIR